MNRFLQILLPVLSATVLFFSSTAYGEQEVDGVQDVRTETEWFKMELFAWGMVDDEGGLGPGAEFRLFTLRWDSVFLTIACLGGGYAWQFDEHDGSAGFVNIGPAIGFIEYLEESGQHQLRFGLGVEFAGMVHGSGEFDMGLHLLPTISYVSEQPTGSDIGVGIRLVLPAVSSSFGKTIDYYPFAVALTLSFGD